MSIDDNNFNDIADELALGDTNRGTDANAGGKSSAALSENAEEQLRKILGEAESSGRGVHDAHDANNTYDANVSQNASYGVKTGTEAARNDASYNEPADPLAESDTGPDPSLVNWARKLWRSQGSSYAAGSRSAAEKEIDAVRKEGAGKIVRTVLLTALCLIVGIAAALQFRSVASRSSAEPAAEQQINQLLSTINNLHSELGSLTAERDELQNRLELVEQSSQDEQIAALREELNKVRTFAGLTTVKGRGIHIQVDFTERTNVNTVQSRLLLLINELRASGAQAISINGVRILAMTELRVVSDEYISVGARQLIAPYDIYAIGDASNLYSGITMSGSGIVYQIRNIAGTVCTWDIQENIVINGASDDDIKTDKLTPNP